MEKVDQNEIMKTAASQLRSLSAEVLQYREIEEKRDLAEQIIKKSSFDLSGDEFIEKRAELMDKDLDELIIINKAVELTKTGELNLGSLSSDSADYGTDALSEFIGNLQ